MTYKLISVFFDENGNPFKDVAREVPCSIINGAFIGASKTTRIYFYYDKLLNEDDDPTTWVAVSKLPNGKIGSKVLESYYDDEIEEHYALLELDSFYTQYKGDVYLALQGYQDGVQVLKDDETGIYTIVGTPTIQTTGNIRLNILYAPQFIGSGETQNVNFQQILADLSTKLGIRTQTILVDELPATGETNIFYVIENDTSNPKKANIYIWNGKTQSYVWVGDNTLFLGDYYTTEQGEDFENYIRNQLSVVASGSPAGVYSTLTDLTTADPDHTKIYVVTATGNWYYWDGTQWTSGGQYQASSLGSDFVVLPQNCVFFDNSENLFDVTNEECLYGKYYNTSGTLITNKDYNQTYLIPVFPSTDYSCTDKDYFVLWYDINKTLIGNTSATTFTTNGYVTSPSNAYYARFLSSSSLTTWNNLVVVQSNTQPTTYIPYSQKIKNKHYSQVEPKNCSFFNYSPNLFDINNSDNVLRGYYNTSGTFVSNSSYNQSYLIPVEEGKYYSSSYTDGFVLWYNASEELIGNTTSTEFARNKRVLAPANSKYARFLAETQYWQNLIVVQSNVQPTQYIPYGTKIKPEYYDTNNSISLLLSGKKILSYGDSIVARNDWQPYIASFYDNVTLVNQGIGSTTVAYIESRETQYPCLLNATRIANLESQNPDVVFILCGINDLALNVSLGTTTQLITPFASKDITTYYGAYSKLIETLLTWKPTLRIVLMTIMSTPQYNATQFAQAVRDIADYYALPYIDLATKCGISRYNSSAYTSDGLHPNTAGGKIIGSLAINELFKMFCGQ